MAARNAVRVLPEPVGAATRVDSPAWIAGQACTCAGVGAGKCARNQPATAGWNADSTSARRARGEVRGAVMSINMVAREDRHKDR